MLESLILAVLRHGFLAAPLPHHQPLSFVKLAGRCEPGEVIRVKNSPRDRSKNFHRQLFE